MTARALPILMYHHVSPAPGLVTVSPATFRAQMRYLAENGWRTVGAEDLARYLAGERLPHKSVLITFDDGYLDNWVHAHPVLVEFHQRAVLFVATAWMGEGPVRRGAVPTPDHKTCKARIAAGAADEVMLRTSEIEAMRAANTFEFHSHTHTHTRWDKQLPAGPARVDAFAADLAQSSAWLASRLGVAPQHLCWPQGYFEPDYLTAARAQGYRFFYTTEKRVTSPHADPEHLGRLVVKDRVGSWFARQLFLYRHPLLGGLYTRLRGA